MEQPMTDLETIVYQWLTRRNIPFNFQTSLMGGHYELGGTVVDFLLPDKLLAWRVQGEYWHQKVDKQGQDEIQREQLATLGYTVIDLWGEDLENRPEETLRLALQGQEMLR